MYSFFSGGRYSDGQPIAKIIFKLYITQCILYCTILKGLGISTRTITEAPSDSLSVQL